jgi:hypothetical protein
MLGRTKLVVSYFIVAYSGWAEENHENPRAGVPGFDVIIKIAC